MTRLACDARAVRACVRGAATTATAGAVVHKQRITGGVHATRFAPRVSSWCGALVGHGDGNRHVPERWGNLEAARKRRGGGIPRQQCGSGARRRQRRHPVVAQFGRKTSRGGAHQRGGRQWHFSQDLVRGGTSGCRGVDKWCQ
jgi:hypothetical protein